jgi:predicted phosphoribosyltransferase
MYDVIEAISRRASNPFRLRFKDRTSAARILADLVKNKIGGELNNAIVLGIPRAGVLTADIVARRLGISDFDILIPIKVSTPDNKENAIGAVMEDGTTYLDSRELNKVRLSRDLIEIVREKAIAETRRRSKIYKYSLVRLNNRVDLNEKTVILVDDGASTGSTLMVAVKWLRMNEKKYGYRIERLIIALPIAPKMTVQLLQENLDCQIAIVLSPSKFYSVQSYHDEFQPVTDNEVVNILFNRGLISSL